MMIGLSLGPMGQRGKGTPPGSVAPVITAVAITPAGGKAGDTFTATVASSGTPAPVLEYQWLNGGVPVPGATGASFVAQEAGPALAVRVRAVNSGGQATLTSAPVAVVAVEPPPPLEFGAAVQSVSYDADGDVTIATRPLAATEGHANLRHFAARLTGMSGKTPTVRVTRGQLINTTPTPARWWLAWSYDPHGDQWSRFDTLGSDATHVTGKNTQAFTSDLVYVAHVPLFTNGRWAARTADWIASPLTRPTPSGNAAYEIGTFPAVAEKHYGTEVPAYTARAFCFGTGPHPIILHGNVHVDEHPGAYIMEGAIDWLLSDDPRAVGLRQAATFFCYPGSNPQARHLGMSRGFIETVGVGTERDANRRWTATDTTSNVALYRAAWSADVPGASPRTSISTTRRTIFMRHRSGGTRPRSPQRPETPSGPP